MAAAGWQRCRDNRWRAKQPCRRRKTPGAIPALSAVVVRTCIPVEENVPGRTRAKAACLGIPDGRCCSSQADGVGGGSIVGRTVRGGSNYCSCILCVTWFWLFKCLTGIRVPFFLSLSRPVVRTAEQHATCLSSFRFCWLVVCSSATYMFP